MFGTEDDIHYKARQDIAKVIQTFHEHITELALKHKICLDCYGPYDGWQCHCENDD